MRFKLDFVAEKSEINSDYRKYVLSYIKNALSKSVNGDLLNRYYTDTKTKDFTWTMIVSKPQFTKDKLQFADNRFSILFSADDKAQTGMYLMLAFLNQKNKKYPTGDDNYITLKNIIQLNQKEMEGTTARFVSMPGSSIIVREHDRESNKDRYYTCEDENYAEKLEWSLQTQAEMAGFSEQTVKEIKVISVMGKKIVVKHYGVYIDAVIADMKISASRAVLQHFYLNGVCSRRSSGFGMVDLVEEG